MKRSIFVVVAVGLLGFVAVSAERPPFVPITQLRDVDVVNENAEVAAGVGSVFLYVPPLSVMGYCPTVPLLPICPPPITSRIV